MHIADHFYDGILNTGLLVRFQRGALLNENDLQKLATRLLFRVPTFHTRFKRRPRPCSHVRPATVRSPEFSGDQLFIVDILALVAKFGAIRESLTGSAEAIRCRES